MQNRARPQPTDARGGADGGTAPPSPRRRRTPGAAPRTPPGPPGPSGPSSRYPRKRNGMSRAAAGPGPGWPVNEGSAVPRDLRTPFPATSIAAAGACERLGPHPLAAGRHRYQQGPNNAARGDKGSPVRGPVLEDSSWHGTSTPWRQGQGATPSFCLRDTKAFHTPVPKAAETAAQTLLKTGLLLKNCFLPAQNTAVVPGFCTTHTSQPNLCQSGSSPPNHLKKEC